VLFLPESKALLAWNESSQGLWFSVLAGVTDNMSVTEKGKKAPAGAKPAFAAGIEGPCTRDQATSCPAIRAPCTSSHGEQMRCGRACVRGGDLSTRADGIESKRREENV
jgi:hypothetical protein